MIKRCMSFNPKERPSFEQITIEMYKHSFKLSDKVDSELVLRRYRSLNRFHSMNKQNKNIEVKPPSQPKSQLPPLRGIKLISKPVIKKPI